MPRLLSSAWKLRRGLRTRTPTGTVATTTDEEGIDCGHVEI